MARNLVPVSVDGIEFDALINEDKNYTSDIPEYPTEDGFSVSDTIILKPFTVDLVLYVTNTPVTWLKKHGSSTDRVNAICNRLEELYFARKLVKVVTTDAIYTDMGIVSIAIAKSPELGYSRQVSISLKKVYVTSRKTTSIPDYVLKSGETASNAGKATTSTTASGSASSSSSKSGSSSSTAEAKKKSSILYGAAQGLGFL
ncbi:phage baseplate protein [Lacrimispora sp.]|uniref:phage baseplate protein n=1 Tax=Lacrimispora sp. TaxID=2719234 RepID=UPI0028B10F10|nr:hypothetical protein [Lacrimispora sp.]